MTIDRERLKQSLADLASRGVYLGTSSWKYVGWRTGFYDEARYVWRGRWSEARFQRLCLAEYAEVFHTVSVDAAYYRFPERRWLEEWVSQVPASFLFSLKVTDVITIKRFPKLPRFQSRAGSVNEGFLDVRRFAVDFLSPLEPFQKNIGLLIFEFSRFSSEDFPRGREFVSALGSFLGQLPHGWSYGVEIRNRQFLHEEYFACLHRFGVVPVFNSWTDMPPVDEQMDAWGGARTDEPFGARLLLRPGRPFEQAVKRFSPYDRVRELYPEVRGAGARMIVDALERPRRGGTFIYVNNRLEGNAIETIEAMLSLASQQRNRSPEDGDPKGSGTGAGK